MREKVVKFDRSFDEGKEKYIMTDNRVVWKGKIPYLFYNIGTSLPKDMTLRENAPPSNIIYQLVAGAMMQPPQSWKQKFADPKQMFTMLALGGIALLVFLVFSMQGDVTRILQAVT